MKKAQKIHAALENECRRNVNFEYRYYDVRDTFSQKPLLWIVAFDLEAQRRMWITDERSQYCITVDRTDERGKNSGNPYYVFCFSQKAVVEELQKMFHNHVDVG